MGLPKSFGGSPGEGGIAEDTGFGGGREPFLDSLLIEKPDIDVASEGRRIRGPPYPFTGVPFLLGGARTEPAGLPIRLISPPAKRGNLRSNS